MGEKLYWKHQLEERTLITLIVGQFISKQADGVIPFSVCSVK